MIIATSWQYFCPTSNIYLLVHLFSFIFPAPWNPTHQLWFQNLICILNLSSSLHNHYNHHSNLNHSLSPGILPQSPFFNHAPNLVSILIVWEIFYKRKSDHVICLPRILQWFSVSLWHKPDSLLWPPWPPRVCPCYFLQICFLPLSPFSILLPPHFLQVVRQFPASGFSNGPSTQQDYYPPIKHGSLLILVESTKMSVLQRNLPWPPGMNSDVANSEAYVIWEKFF